MRKSTMLDVAKKAKVSKSTVSQYINNRFMYMSDSTKKRIKDAIEELQYVPNYTAKSLKQKQTRTIGIIVANSLHLFSSEIIHSIEEESEKNGFQVFVCNADDNSEKEKKYIDILLAKQVDGLIIFPTSGNLDYYKYLKKLNFPIVFIDRKVEGNIYPTFLLDNLMASELAVKYFKDNQIEKTGIVLPPLVEGLTPRLERLEGFQKEAADKNLILKNEWIISGNEISIQQQLNSLYDNEILPEAFFTVNDVSLIELIKFLNYKCIKVPNDINVITIDDSLFLDLLAPSIRIIKQPAIKMGRTATKYLLEIIYAQDFKKYYNVTRFLPTLKY